MPANFLCISQVKYSAVTKSLAYTAQTTGKLSHTLQATTGNIASSMAVVEMTLASLHQDDSMKEIARKNDDDIQRIIEASARMEEDKEISREQEMTVRKRYLENIVTKMEKVFSDKISQLAD